MDSVQKTLSSNPIFQRETPLPKAKNAMGKDDFMKLLLTQMKNQDPLKPMDHQEFATQLAQFSSLEQLSNIGKGIDSLHAQNSEGSKLQALSMIGKQVQASSQEVFLMEGQNVSLMHSLPPGVSPNKALIYDASGKLVREMELPKDLKGDIVWDGKDSLGKAQPSGNYRFRISGINDQGASYESSGEISGKVVGMEMQGKTPLLVVESENGKTKVKLEKISQVLESATPLKKVEPTPLKKKEPEVPPSEKQAIEGSEEPKNESASEDSVADESDIGLREIPFRETVFR